MVAEQGHDLLGLVHAHQPVVDEDAGQLIADRLMNEHCGNRGVDAARQPADNLAITNLRANFFDLGLAEFGHRPLAGEAADMAHEIGQQFSAVGGMNHLGVELRAVIFALFVGDDRKRRPIACRDDLETGCKARDLVTMAHPDLMTFAVLP